MELTTYQIAIGYFMYYVNPFYAFIIILRMFNILYYSIHGDKDLMTPIIRKLSPYINTMYMKNLNGRPQNDGYFWCKYAIGYINSQEDNLYILTRPSFYEKIISSEELVKEVAPIVKSTENCKIDMYLRKGSYKGLYYARFTIDIGHINPIGQQQDIVDDILSIYNKQQRATVFIHGVTGAGKSTIGFLLAKYTSGVYCHSFNPTDPGDNLTSLLMDIGTVETPIIIVLEESDIIIESIHHESIVKHIEMPTLIHNKTSWSTFLDDMVFYKGVMLVLTSNTSKEDIDKIDSSYLRDGRIHKSYNMSTPISLHELQEEKATDQTESKSK